MPLAKDRNDFHVISFSHRKELLPQLSHVRLFGLSMFVVRHLPSVNEARLRERDRVCKSFILLRGSYVKIETDRNKTVRSDGDTIYRMECVITSIHCDVVEIEFNRGFPNINDYLIVKKPAGDLILEVHYPRRIYESNGVSVSRRFTDDKVSYQC
jgi:hypothetical protein